MTDLEYPLHMFWLKDKNNNFQLFTLIMGPDVNILYIFPYHAGYFLCITLPLNFHPMNSRNSCYHQVPTCRVENSVDPYQLDSKKPADLELH